MRKVQIVLALALALVIAHSAVAAEKKAEKKGEKKAQPCPAMQRIERLTEGLNVTADQKAQFAPLCKEFGPKMKEVMKKGDVLTAEQKKDQAEAMKAAKAAGKTGKDFFTAVAAAVKLTDEQKAKQAEARKEMGALEKDLREKVLGILTAEQKEQVKKKADAAKKKAAK